MAIPAQKIQEQRICGRVLAVSRRASASPHCVKRLILILSKASRGMAVCAALTERGQSKFTLLGTRRNGFLRTQP